EKTGHSPGPSASIAKTCVTISGILCRLLLTICNKVTKIHCNDRVNKVNPKKESCNAETDCLPDGCGPDGGGLRQWGPCPRLYPGRSDGPARLRCAGRRQRRIALPGPAGLTRLPYYPAKVVKSCRPGGNPTLRPSEEPLMHAEIQNLIRSFGQLAD